VPSAAPKPAAAAKPTTTKAPTPDSNTKPALSRTSSIKSDSTTTKKPTTTSKPPTLKKESSSIFKAFASKPKPNAPAAVTRTTSASEASAAASPAAASPAAASPAAESPAVDGTPLPVSKSDFDGSLTDILQNQCPTHRPATTTRRKTTSQETHSMGTPRRAPQQPIEPQRTNGKQTCAR